MLTDMISQTTIGSVTEQAITAETIRDKSFCVSVCLRVISDDGKHLDNLYEIFHA